VCGGARIGSVDAVDDALDRLDVLRERNGSIVDLHEMLAFGLFNALATAKEREQRQRHDTLYGRLWSLQRELTAQERIARACAKALFGQLLEAERAADTELLARLTADMPVEQARLASMDLEEARHILAKALARRIEPTVGRDDVGERDAIVAELRALRATYPNDRTSAGRLAYVLIHALNHARDHGEDELADELADEIREISSWLKATR
jgi:hypothetical protein